MRQGVWAVQLKSIRRQKRGDHIVRHHRATSIHMPGDIPETHPAFIGAWARAEAQASTTPPTKARTAAGSVAAIVGTMRSSAQYKTRSPGYGLRKFRLTMIAEAGGSAHAIMPWGGHKSLSEARHCTDPVSRKHLVVGPEQERCIRAASDTKSARNKLN